MLPDIEAVPSAQTNRDDAPKGGYATSWTGGRIRMSDSLLASRSTEGVWQLSGDGTPRPGPRAVMLEWLRGPPKQVVISRVFAFFRVGAFGVGMKAFAGRGDLGPVSVAAPAETVAPNTPASKRTPSPPFVTRSSAATCERSARRIALTRRARRSRCTGGRIRRGRGLVGYVYDRISHLCRPSRSLPLLAGLLLRQRQRQVWQHVMPLSMETPRHRLPRPVGTALYHTLAESQRLFSHPRGRTPSLPRAPLMRRGRW